MSEQVSKTLDVAIVSRRKNVLGAFAGAYAEQAAEWLSEALDVTEDRAIQTFQIIAYELIQNLLRYNQRAVGQFRVRLNGEQILLESESVLEAQEKTCFEGLLKRLQNSDAESLWLMHLQRSRASFFQRLPVSGLGLITLVKDYPVTLSWRFIPFDELYSVVLTLQYHYRLHLDYERDALC